MCVHAYAFRILGACVNWSDVGLRPRDGEAALTICIATGSAGWSVESVSGSHFAVCVQCGSQECRISALRLRPMCARARSAQAAASSCPCDVRLRVPECQCYTL